MKVGTATTPARSGFRIGGTAYERPARVEVNDSELRWMATKGALRAEPEELRLHISDLEELSLREHRWTGASWIGAMMIGAACLWQFSQAASLPVCVALAIAGALGIALRRQFPEVLLHIRTANQTLTLRVGTFSVGACRAAVRGIHAARRELSGVPALPLFSRETWSGVLLSLRLLFLSDEALRRMFVGGPDPVAQSRYVRECRRSSWWNVGWFLILPIVGALGVQLALPKEPAVGVVIRVGLWFFLLLIAGLLLQSQLSRRAGIKRWLSGD